VRFKDGVSINGIRPELLLGMYRAETVYKHNAPHNYPFTITSVCDGTHSENSLHYRGLAFDMRTWRDQTGGQWTRNQKGLFANALRRWLGPEWDVVVEATHIHVEFDPNDRS